MKLKPNGLVKILEQIPQSMTIKDAIKIEKIEFEPSDFKEVIILTVEEAGILVRCAANEFCRLIMEHAPIDSAREVEALMYDLVKRIGQVEATKICDDYNKALNKVAEEFQKQEEIINLKCEIEQLKAEQELDNWLKDQFLKVWRTSNESN